MLGKSLLLGNPHRFFKNDLLKDVKDQSKSLLADLPLLPHAAAQASQDFANLSSQIPLEGCSWYLILLALSPLPVVGPKLSPKEAPAHRDVLAIHVSGICSGMRTFTLQPRPPCWKLKKASEETFLLGRTLLSQLSSSPGTIALPCGGKTSNTTSWRETEAHSLGVVTISEVAARPCCPHTPESRMDGMFHCMEPWLQTCIHHEILQPERKLSPEQPRTRASPMVILSVPKSWCVMHGSLMWPSLPLHPAWPGRGGYLPLTLLGEHSSDETGFITHQNILNYRKAVKKETYKLYGDIRYTERCNHKSIYTS